MEPVKWSVVLKLTPLVVMMLLLFCGISYLYNNEHQAFVGAAHIISYIFLFNIIKRHHEKD